MPKGTPHPKLLLEKVCPLCREMKPISCYHRNKSNVSGFASYCKDCSKIMGQIKYAKNKGTINAKNSAWYQKHKDRIQREQKERIKNNPGMLRERELKRRFGLTLDAFADLLREQNYRCAACGTTEPGGYYNQWTVDHDHACCAGRKTCGSCIRGILCVVCNVTLGNSRDDAERLMGLAKYLDRYAESEYKKVA